MSKPPMTETLRERVHQIIEDKLFPIFGAGPYEDTADAVLATIHSHDGLREALERARGAIASLPDDALGFGFVAPEHDGATGYQYPQRDELLAYIDRALAGDSQ